MAKYIDADRLKEAFNADTEHIRDWDVDLYDLFMFEIDEQPTADVQEVKHGEWIQAEENKCRCSNCDIITLIALYPHGDKNYCPNCGAKMDKE